jgi:hypothetical protein
MFAKMSAGFDKVVAVSIDKSGNLLIGANTVLDNAGSITALEKIRGAGEGINAVVWAGNAEEEAKLKALGVDRIAQVMVGFPEVLKTVGFVARGKTVVIGSEADFAAVKDAAGVSDIDDYLVNTLKVKAVKLAKPDARNKLVNAMPLVFARAVASIVDDQAAAVKRAVVSMIRAYERNDWISHDQAAELEKLSKQIVDIPLVTLGEEVASIQMSYEETLRKL